MDFFLDGVSGLASDLQAVGNVVKNLHMRKERIVLEYESHVSFICRNFSDVLTVQ